MLSLFCLAVRLDKGVVSKETVVRRRCGAASLLESLYGGQFTLSTPLIKPNFC